MSCHAMRFGSYFSLLPQEVHAQWFWERFSVGKLPQVHYSLHQKCAVVPSCEPEASEWPAAFELKNIKKHSSIFFFRSFVRCFSKENLNFSSRIWVSRAPNEIRPSCRGYPEHDRILGEREKRPKRCRKPDLPPDVWAGALVAIATCVKRCRGTSV